MGAAVKEKKDIGYRVFLAGLAIVLLVLSRYVVNGEPVDVRSDEAEITTALPLYDGIEIRQPLHITEEMNWRQGYYALFFAECDRNSIGQLICTLEQGAEPGSVEIELREMEQGAWLRLGSLPLGNWKAEKPFCIFEPGMWPRENLRLQRGRIIMDSVLWITTVRDRK